MSLPAILPRDQAIIRSETILRRNYHSCYMSRMNDSCPFQTLPCWVTILYGTEILFLQVTKNPLRCFVIFQPQIMKQKMIVLETCQLKKKKTLFAFLALFWQIYFCFSTRRSFFRNFGEWRKCLYEEMKPLVLNKGIQFLLSTSMWDLLKYFSVLSVVAFYL